MLGAEFSWFIQAPDALGSKVEHATIVSMEF